MKPASYLASLRSHLANDRPATKHALHSVAWTWNLARTRNRRFLGACPPGHFYSPIPDLAVVPAVFEGLATTCRGIPDIALDDAGQVALTKRFGEYHDEMPFSHTAVPGRPFYLDNGWFGYGDATILYSMIRHASPRRIVEVGSGFSSGAMIETNQRFFDGAIDLTFVEPNPERLRKVLDGSRFEATVLVEEVQRVDGKHFSDLEAGDILFVDSSHVAKLGSDVLHLLFRVLPSLSSGVHIHFHDILWPFEYPREWIESGRAWNEAYFVRAFLQNNDAYDVTYFGSYMEQFHRDLLGEHIPSALRRPSARRTPANSSLWLTKR